MTTRKKRTIVGLILSVSLLSLTPAIWASGRTGTIALLRVGGPPGAGNPDRVSVLLNDTKSPSACPTTGWFAYEGAVSTNIGYLMTSALLAAYEAGTTVHIVGTGTCDKYGVEEISFIDLQN